MTWHSLDAVLVDHLISAEEPKGVGVVLESLDDSENALEITLVIAAHWVFTIQTLTASGSVDIKDHVDTGGVEDGGALVVVGLRV